MQVLIEFHPSQLRSTLKKHWPFYSSRLVYCQVSWRLLSGQYKPSHLTKSQLGSWQFVSSPTDNRGCIYSCHGKRVLCCVPRVHADARQKNDGCSISNRTWSQELLMHRKVLEQCLEAATAFGQNGVEIHAPCLGGPSVGGPSVGSRCPHLKSAV